MSDQRDGGIGWTDQTWNPIRGCSKVSQGCKHCYAETVARRFSKPGQPYEGLVRDDGTWNGEIRFVETALGDPLRWTRPRRVFVNSMSDLFHENVSTDWLDRIFAIMALASRHTFQVLTKRPERMREYLSDPVVSKRIANRMLDDHAGILAKRREIMPGNGFNLAGIRNWPLPNVWLIVSVEDEPTAQERIDQLLRTPAAVRGVSYEPALEGVNFEPYFRDRLLEGHVWRPCYCDELAGDPAALPCPPCFAQLGVDWVVVGGESGNGARPFDLAWARSTVAQCRAAGVPVFVKQLGSRPFDSDYLFGVYAPQDRRSPSKPDGAGGEMARGNLVLVTRKGGDMAEWPEDLRVQEWPK